MKITNKKQTNNTKETKKTTTRCLHPEGERRSKVHQEHKQQQQQQISTHN